MNAKDVLRALIRGFGFDVIRYNDPSNLPPDFSDEAAGICTAVAPFTMTTPERIKAVIDSVKYLESHEIEGAYVECGVWKGGSAMAMALALNNLGIINRHIYLYDTYTGMSEPGENDISLHGDKAIDKFSKTKLSDDASDWCHSGLDEVKANIYTTGYPQDKLHFIKGKVEDTIPARMPDKIALLRLDTDWYESTKHEMSHLFPLLQNRGVLILDDYGHWEGARKAIDEYIAEHNICILLNRIDYAGRIAVKT